MLYCTILTQAEMKTSLLGMVDSRHLDPVTDPHFRTTTGSLAPGVYIYNNHLLTALVEVDQAAQAWLFRHICCY